MAILFDMAISTIKATYTVDVETKRTLDRLAVQWDVSRSEALRRAIRQAAGASAAEHRLAALTALQQQARLQDGTLARWSKQQRGQRRRSSAEVERRRT
jgi:predicted transcriptional regulator